jgi:hypothetical protein
MARGRPGPGKLRCLPSRAMPSDRHRFGLPSAPQRLGRPLWRQRRTLARHAANHLPAQARAAIMTQLAPSQIDLEQLQRSESESLLASLIAQRARLSAMATQALESDLPGVAVRCENAILQTWNWYRASLVNL